MSAIGREHGTDRRWLPLAAIVLVALACNTAWGRPSVDARPLGRLLAAHGFSPAETRTALATLALAEARGLPAPALESRLREGLARHARPAVIQRVLDRRLSELTRADRLLRSGARQGLALRDRESSLTRLADSLAMGVAPRDVASVFPAAAGAKRDLDSASRAAEVMGRLARQGSPAADTRDVLAAALAAGWTRDQMDGLVGVFASARRLGVAPGKTRQTLADGIRKGKGPDRLSEDVKAGAPAGGAKAAGARPRAGASRSGSPKGKSGVSSPRGPRTPSRGGAPRAPAPRPHPRRGPAHRGPHR